MGCGGSKDETASPNDVVLAAAPAARPRAGSNASEPRSSMVGGIFKSAGRRPSQDEEEGVEYDMQGRRIVEIGMPTNFQHVMHMGWTAEGGFKVEEMPDQWKQLFKSAGVKKKDLQDVETAKMVVETLAANMTEEEIAAMPALPGVSEEIQKAQTRKAQAAMVAKIKAESAAPAAPAPAAPAPAAPPPKAATPPPPIPADYIAEQDAAAAKAAPPLLSEGAAAANGSIELPEGVSPKGTLADEVSSGRASISERRISVSSTPPPGAPPPPPGVALSAAAPAPEEPSMLQRLGSLCGSLKNMLAGAPADADADEAAAPAAAPTGLLADIAKGAQLKKAPAPAMPAMSSQAQLMGAIRGGAMLKSVPMEQRGTFRMGKAPPPPEGTGTIADTLAAAMAARRGLLSKEPNDESDDDDDDWD